MIRTIWQVLLGQLFRGSFLQSIIFYGSYAACRVLDLLFLPPKIGFFLIDFAQVTSESCSVLVLLNEARDVP
jgi:hypothetical protein